MKRGTKSKSKAGEGGRGGPRAVERARPAAAAVDGRSRRAGAAAASPERDDRGRAQRFGEWLAIAALVVPPLVVVPVALEAFRLPQRMLAEWLALASLVALAWAGSMRASALKRSTALFAALPLLLLAAASFFTTTHRAHVAEALPDFAIGIAALVGWSLAIDRERLRRVLDAALVPAAALAAIAILQLHHLWQPVLFGEPLTDERMGITSLAGNPGDLAALLVLPCIVAQAGLPGARGGARWWRLVVLAVCVYALAGTQTLTSLIAAVAGSLVLWAALLPRRRLLAGAAAVAAAALLLVTLVRPLRERVVGLRAALTSVEELNEALSGRLDGWWVAMRLLRDHPLAGVGFGAYRAEFAPAKLALLAEGVPFFAGHVNPSFANAHSEYLEIGAELGWPGVLALAWGAALVLRAAWRTRSRPAAERALAWGGIVALALLALAYFPLRLGPVAFAWIAWIAWLLGGDEVVRRRDANDEAEAAA